MKIFVFVLTVCLGVRGDLCSQYQDCTDCLNPKDPSLDCGWCSPDPAVFSDGSAATQCMDHRSKGWTCYHLYSHDGCISGYVCNTTSGMCELGAGGEGDTQENCEKSCNQAETLYSCNITSLQCVEDPTGSSADEESCNSLCTNSTPTDLIGIWRGLKVQLNFSIGEHVLNFTENTIAWGPLNESQRQGTVISVGESLLQILTSENDLLYAAYSTVGWPTGPEVRGIAIALQRGKQLPPTDIVDAMGDPENFDVYVMVQCNPWKSDLCDFSSVLLESNKKHIQQRPFLDHHHHHQQAARSYLRHTSRLPFNSADDPCSIHTDCESCINDPASVCGFCDGIITYGDGSTCGEDGSGCCGGSDGFSQCDLAYRRDCPVVCDWTDWTSPICRSATSQEISAGTATYTDCDAISSWCLATIQFCNATELKCYTVESTEDCDNTPGCDSTHPGCDNCTAPVEAEYYYCTDIYGCQGPLNKTQCESTEGCDASSTDGSSCDPTLCLAQTYYTCDTSDSTCKQHSGIYPTDTTFYNTSSECSTHCFTVDITGVWRGLRIDSDFVKDEWDFQFFTNGSVIYVSRLASSPFYGTYTIGSAIESSDDTQIYTLQIILDDASIYTGLISDGMSQGPLTKFLYLGLPLTQDTSVSSFDDAMLSKNQEFVLFQCLSTVSYCDFSSATPSMIASSASLF